MTPCNRAKDTIAGCSPWFPCPSWRIVYIAVGLHIYTHHGILPEVSLLPCPHHLVHWHNHLINHMALRPTTTAMTNQQIPPKSNKVKPTGAQKKRKQKQEQHPVIGGVRIKEQLVSWTLGSQTGMKALLNKKRSAVSVTQSAADTQPTTQFQPPSWKCKEQGNYTGPLKRHGSG